MDKLESLIEKVANLDPIKEKKIAAFIGAIVGDAACIHLEWIYDDVTLVEKGVTEAKVTSSTKSVTEGKDPAFWPKSHNPFFTLPNGKVSCYADQAIQSLNVLVQNEGKFETDKLISHFMKYFGDSDSDYQKALIKRREMKWPVDGPWLHGALISMIDRHKAEINPPGSDFANEHDGLTTLLPLLIQQSPNLNWQELQSCLSIMTQDPEIMKYHEAEAFLINEYIKGNEDPFQATISYFEDQDIIVQKMNAVFKGKKSGKSSADLVRQFGWTCPLPGSFQSALVSILEATSYADAIRETILCGGDCCARSNLIGACLGARFGIKNIPTEWIKKVDDIEDIMEKCLKMYS